MEKTIIAVGSTNSTKIEPVQKVFSHHFRNIEVKGISVDSGIPEQPVGSNQMYEGALNRAKRALEKVKEAEYGVGIEGGIHEYSYGWFEFSLIVIVNRKGEIGIGSSGKMHLPEKIVKQLKEGKNLEQAVDSVFGTKEIGEGIGAFGMFTKGYVTRSSGVEHGVAFALARFLHEGLY